MNKLKYTPHFYKLKQQIKSYYTNKTYTKTTQNQKLSHHTNTVHEKLERLSRGPFSKLLAVTLLFQLPFIQ